MNMKHSIIAVICIDCLMFLFQGCSSYPNNEYLGRLPIIEFEYHKKIYDCKDLSLKSSLYSQGKDELDAEKEKLLGTIISCKSQNPEIFEVEGNQAVASIREQDGALVYTAKIIITNDLYCYSPHNYARETRLEFKIDHCNNNDELLKTTYESFNAQAPIAIGSEHYPGIQLQYSPNVEVVDVNTNTGEHKMKISDNYMDYWRNVDRILLSVRSTPAIYAVQVQEQFYNAIVKKDYEEFYGLDYGISEDDGYSSDTDNKIFWYNYEHWKMQNPEKWKVIKEFRLKELRENHDISFKDVEDPK